MLSNQVLQRTISEIENIAGGSCSVWALDGHRIVQAGTQRPGGGERDQAVLEGVKKKESIYGCLFFTSPSPRDRAKNRLPSSA